MDSVPGGRRRPVDGTVPRVTVTSVGRDTDLSSVTLDENESEEDWGNQDQTEKRRDFSGPFSGVCEDPCRGLNDPRSSSDPEFVNVV